MNRLEAKKVNAARRRNRVRTRIQGDSHRPRLTVNVSNYHVSVQLIDDVNGQTMAYATTVGQKIDGSLSAKAEWAGKEIALKAKKVKVSKAIFDRGKRKYHGRIKLLAMAARDNGLEF